MGCDLLWIPAWGYGWVMIRWHGLAFSWATGGRLKKNMIMMMIHLKIGHGHCHGLDEQGQRVRPAKRGSIKRGRRGIGRRNERKACCSIRSGGRTGIMAGVW